MRYSNQACHSYGSRSAALKVEVYRRSPAHSAFGPSHRNLVHHIKYVLLILDTSSMPRYSLCSSSWGKVVSLTWRCLPKRQMNSCCSIYCLRDGQPSPSEETIRLGLDLILQGSFPEQQVMRLWRSQCIQIAWIASLLLITSLRPAQGYCPAPSAAQLLLGSNAADRTCAACEAPTNNTLYAIPADR